MLTGIVREYGEELLHCDYSQWDYCRMVSQHEVSIITGDEVFDFATYCGGKHVPIFGVSNFNPETCHGMATLNACGESLQ